MQRKKWREESVGGSKERESGGDHDQGEGGGAKECRRKDGSARWCQGLGLRWREVRGGREERRGRDGKEKNGRGRVE